ncbi:MAG: sigma-70 family RNA polymerase sigma factor [Verrucomicrobiae bacterium]|nr:sigma-70 family RNA polymerase sigma factor [Verrucomicrobiae bacterium]
MSTENPTPKPAASAAGIFATTHWTCVLTAGRGGSPQAEMALEELCRTYWYPLYAYVRRQGHSREDAEDLTQGFFTRLLEKNYLEGISSDKGRFRAFLLVALKRYMINEWHHANRQKRGGGVAPLSLDWRDADTRYLIDPTHELSPDKLYDRAWAMVVLERVITRLRAENGDDKAALYEQLKPFLMIGKSEIPYARAAVSLNLTEGAVRVAVHRLRRRYRELLREEITQTLAHPAQADEEMSALFSALTGG